jgi:hypothetical protein
MGQQIKMFSCTVTQHTATRKKFDEQYLHTFSLDRHDC